MIPIARLLLIAACICAYWWLRLLGAVFGNRVLISAGEACSAASFTVGAL